MPAVTVFVDRVVRGDLPMVCAKTGARAMATARVTSSVRSAGWAWLLVFAGPPGWLALLVVLWIGGEQLEGRVPLSQEAWDRIQQRTRGAWVAVGVALVGTLLAAVLQAPVLGGVVAAALVAALILGVAANWATVGMDLDASRRWVTLSGVHPSFVAAVRALDERERSTRVR